MHYILWLDKCRIQYIVEFLLTQIFIYANIVTVAHTCGATVYCINNILYDMGCQSGKTLVLP